MNDNYDLRNRIVSMSYKELKQCIDEYNWDDGFEVPHKILMNPNCDLAMALELFYLWDGLSFFEKTSNNVQTEEWQTKWISFIKELYNNILNGKYPKTSKKYDIPLSRVRKYKLRKKNMPEVFLDFN